MRIGKFIFGASQDMPDIFFASGFNCPDPFIYFSCAGMEAVVVPILELGRALHEVKPGIKVYERSEFLLESLSDGAAKPSLDAVVRGIVSRFPADKWILPRSTPCMAAEILKNAGAVTELCIGDFFPERKVKTGKELSAILKSMSDAEKAMEKTVKIISRSKIGADGFLYLGRKPLSSEMLKIEINVEIVRRGGGVGGTIASSGKDSSEPHNTGRGPIRAGEPIVIDIFPRDCESGYWGDMTRTFVKGKASKKLRTAYKAVRSARDEAKAMVKAGAVPRQMYNKAKQVLEKHGFMTGKNASGHFGFIHSLGHGVGLEIHEAPWIHAKSEEPLEPGNVLTIEPGLYYPEWGGIRLEDVVHVLEGGFEDLTKFPDFLEIE